MINNATENSYDNEELITTDQITCSFVLTRLLFADDYIESLNNMDNNSKKFIFESVVANIMADVLFTKFDENVNDRLYNILNYFRNYYRNDESFNKINDAIALLNQNNYEPNAYIRQFDLRYNTIFGIISRRNLIRNNYEVVKTLVKQSIVNDLPFFYDINNLNGVEFNKTYGNNLVHVSNATYLLNVFPFIFSDSMALIKIYNLLAYNMDCNETDIIDNDFIYSGSSMTLKKINKMLKKNK